MLIIRLQRGGKNRQPVFRVVLAEKHKSASKKFLEIFGVYNPRNKELALKDVERIKYWIGKNVEVSPTVHNLLVDKQVLTEPKKKAWQPKKKEGAETAATPAQASQAEPAKLEAEAPKEEAKPEEVKA